LYAENKLESIFYGSKTKIFAFGTNFINSGFLTARINFTFDMPPMIQSGMSAWDFINSTVIVQQCSFVNNTNRNRGGAITLLGPNSSLTIRGGTRVSQNLFYNNSGFYAGAIAFYGRTFQIGGKYTNFTNNQGYYAGAVGISDASGYGSNQVNISGTSFVDNLAARLVRTNCSSALKLVSLSNCHFLIYNIILTDTCRNCCITPQKHMYNIILSIFSSEIDSLVDSWW
jgi:hypothetical protein